MVGSIIHKLPVVTVVSSGPPGAITCTHTLSNINCLYIEILGVLFEQLVKRSVAFSHKQLREYT
jgi:hypothetical protein